MKVGGKEGGEVSYVVGLLLVVLGTYLFFDSVRVSSGGAGWISGGISRGVGGFMTTTSMGIIFVPLLAGIVALTYDAEKRWAWVLSGVGVILIVVEILSSIRFVMSTKGSHLVLMLGMIAIGAGLVARAVRADKNKGENTEEKNKGDE